MRLLLAVICLTALASFSAPARADKRIALVIGNSAYQNAPELKNPRNDAADVSAALTRLGFEVVEGQDLDKRAMERLIRQFGTMLSGTDVALFFYAGHGLQVGRQNYLVPTDAKLSSEGDIDFESLPLNLVLKQMEREAKTSLVLLDACRDNPLAKNLARSMGTRSVQLGQGLAEMKTGVGTLIGFSTQPDNVAVDGAGRNSPYAGALIRHIEEPGKDVSGILVEVRNDVLQMTGGSQVPWEHTSLTGQVFFTPPAAAAPSAGGDVASPAPNYDKQMEIAFWNAVKDSKSPTVLQTYLDRFPNGTFAGLARVLIEQQKQPKIASAAPREEPKATGSIADSDPEALTRALQTELRRVGCYPGSIDGKWGARATEGLGAFARHSKEHLAALEPSQEALKAVAAHQGRVCPVQCDADEREVGGKCVAKPKPRTARRKEVEEPPRRGSATVERESKPAKQGNCWQQDGRNFTVGPCAR